jgi:hypothetical protein
MKSVGVLFFEIWAAGLATHIVILIFSIYGYLKTKFFGFIFWIGASSLALIDNIIFHYAVLSSSPPKSLHTIYNGIFLLVAILSILGTIFVTRRFVLMHSKTAEQGAAANP